MARKVALVGFVALGATLIPFSSGGTAARASRPQVKTLLTIRGSATQFVQDGPYVAWGSPGGWGSPTECRVVIRRLGVRRKSAFETCLYGSPQNLVLSGRRAVWVNAGGMTQRYAQVMTAALGDRRARALGEVFTSDRDGGTLPEASAADGDVFLFSLLSYFNCDPKVYGRFVLAGGSIERVSGRTFARFLELPAALLAVHADRVAAVPAPASGCPYNEDPAWSPDGRLIAFASRSEGPDWEIEALPPQGGARRKITDNFRYDGDPAWAPDGSSLAVVTGDSIRTVNADGTNEQTLVSCPEFVGCGSPDWSPDSSGLAFSRQGEVQTELFTVNRDGSGERRLGPGDEPSFSPDGERIAFTSLAAIYVMDADGTNGQRLAGGDGSYYYSPSFSPDGGTIAFTKRDDLESGDSEIHAMNADGSGVRQLTDNLVDDYSPDWSPDGGRLAFARMAGGKEEIYVMNGDGSGQARVTQTKVRLTRFPVEVHSTRDGSLVSRFMPAGEVRAIALTPRFAAVLVKQGRLKRIELFDPASGTRRGSVRVPRTAEGLSAAGRTVVFRAGRTIRVLDAVRRKHKVLTIAGSKPIGLSIDGRRVAWAESGTKRSRIRAVILPRGG